MTSKDNSIISMPEFKRRKQAKVWFEEHYPWIKCDFTGCAVGVLNPMLGQFHRLSLEFPEVAVRVKSIVFRVFQVSDGGYQKLRALSATARKLADRGECDEAQEAQEEADALLWEYLLFGLSCEARGTLEFNNRFCRSVRRFDRHPSEERHDSTDSSFLMTHEFAHMIFGWLRPYEDCITSDDSNDGIYDALWNHLGRQAMRKDRFCGGQVCEELLAEEFTEVRHSRQPSAGAESTVGLLSTIIKEVRAYEAAQG